MNDTLDNFIKKISIEIELSEEKKISPDDEFRKLDEWNSMNALIILSFINIEYETTYSAEEFGKCKTFREIYEVLKSKI